MVARGKVLKLLDAERYVKVMQLYHPFFGKWHVGLFMVIERNIII
jgi:hypothetical protein